MSKENIPRGFSLRYTLQKQKKIYWIVWSPNGEILTSSFNDDTIRLWNIENGELLRELEGSLVLGVSWSPDGEILATGGFQSFILWDAKTGKLRRMPELLYNPVFSMAWSPDGTMLALGTSNGGLRLWDVKKEQLYWYDWGYQGDTHSIAWSPKGQILAIGTDRSIYLWSIRTNERLLTLQNHSNTILSLAWSADGQILASASADRTVQLWDPKTGRHINTLEGHTNSVISISFSFDSSLLASKSLDGTVRLWRCDTWETVSVLYESSDMTSKWRGNLAFHPKLPVLASLGEEDSIIRLWDLDFTTILYTSPTTPSVHYTNSKVVLVGDSGVGKSGLGLVLAGHEFVATESTHGRHIWPFEKQEIQIDEKRSETRETLLWDLAGQPGYRLIHQLYLNEVAVALVVFDIQSETDPFAGVRHWARALSLAQRSQSSSVFAMKKFLIAARVDRGGKNVSRSRIDALVRELNFDGYFETSAKEGYNIASLAEAIRQAISWEILPKVSSSDLFQDIKAFLLAEKEMGRVLSKIDDLYQAFMNSEVAPRGNEDLHAEFETCIGRVESRGLIRKLKFGNLILLQPELLDAYASSLIIAVKEEPEGLGCILEERVKVGDFFVPRDIRIRNEEQEKLLLISMVEDLLYHEIVLRESADDGSYLVFPSQPTRENPDLSDPEGKAVIFDFEGPVLNIYATLVVRLSHSGIFQKKDLWKDAVVYIAKTGGICGIVLKNIGEGRGELTLFYDKLTSRETRNLFEIYIQIHLERRALLESIHQRTIFICPNCATPFTDLQIKYRCERGYKKIRCSVCDQETPLIERGAHSFSKGSLRISRIDQAADSQRDLERAVSIIQGKIETNDFDVFLCCNNDDKLEVEDIGKNLKDLGLLPWFNEWELQPGLPWQKLLESQIEQIKSVAVFVGKEGIGPWQQMELDAFLREFMRRGCPVIPVLLKCAPTEPKLPLFLQGFTWVDFRQDKPDPMEQLLWGITGEK